MKYNLKITEYPDNIQVSYYDIKIERSDNGNDISIYFANDKHNIGNNLSKYYYNTKTGKMEIIPDGYKIQLDPFTGDEVLYKCSDKSEEELQKEHVRNVFRSMRRTKQNVYEIARGSKWDLFVTITIANKDIRFDLDQVKKKIHDTINRIKARHAKDLKYLLVFEKHPKSGAWHLHGLFKNIDGLTLNVAFNPHTGELIYSNDMPVYNIKQFDTVGFNTATYVNDNNRVTQYILKYITKDMAFEYPDKHFYVCSKGLPRGREVLLEVEDETEIDQKLLEELGYVPDLTHCKHGYNIYNGANVKYMQYKK